MVEENQGRLLKKREKQMIQPVTQAVFLADAAAVNDGHSALFFSKST